MPVQTAGAHSAGAPASVVPAHLGYSHLASVGSGQQAMGPGGATGRAQHGGPRSNVCYYFLQNKCRHGENCRFLHSTAGMVGGPPVMQQQQGAGPPGMPPPPPQDDWPPPPPPPDGQYPPPDGQYPPPPQQQPPPPQQPQQQLPQQVDGLVSIARTLSLSLSRAVPDIDHPLYLHVGCPALPLLQPSPPIEPYNTATMLAPPRVIQASELKKGDWVRAPTA